jgi:hypothetical protein
LKLLNGCTWTVKGEWRDREVISMGRQNGAVCEAGPASGFASFDDFQNYIMGNTIEFSSKSMRLTYTSARSGKLEMDTHGTRKLNGTDADLDYPTYGCPYINSEWDSGIIELAHADNRLTLDFIAGTRTRGKRP